MKDVLENHLLTNVPFGSMIEFHPISAKGHRRLNQFVEKSFWGSSLDMRCIRQYLERRHLGRRRTGAGKLGRVRHSWWRKFS